jgi:ribosomal protein S20
VPVTQSAKKALRRDRRRTVINLDIKKKMKAALKKAKERPTKNNLSLAHSVIDRAAKKKVIHQHKASRLKSHLMEASFKPRKSSSNSSKKK